MIFSMLKKPPKTEHDRYKSNPAGHVEMKTTMHLFETDVIKSWL